MLIAKGNRYKMPLLAFDKEPGKAQQAEKGKRTGKA